MKKQSIFVIAIILIIFGIMPVSGQTKIKGRVTDNIEATSGSRLIYIQQGYNMKLWMSNSGVLGFYSFNYGGINLEYPAGSNIEHLFAGGPRIGALVYEIFNRTKPELTGKFEEKFFNGLDNILTPAAEKA